MQCVAPFLCIVTKTFLTVPVGKLHFGSSQTRLLSMRARRSTGYMSKQSVCHVRHVLGTQELIKGLSVPFCLPL